MTQPESSPELTETEEATLDRLSDQGVASYVDGAKRLTVELPHAVPVKSPTASSRADRRAHFADAFGLTGSNVLSPRQLEINKAGRQLAHAVLAKASQEPFVPTAGEIVSLGQPAEQQDINQAGKALARAALAAAQGRSGATPTS